MDIKNNKKKNIHHELMAHDFIPMDEMTQDILRKRSHLLAKADVNYTQMTVLTHYIRFKLGKNEWYGIPYEKTKEVLNNVYLTPVPHVSPYIAGIMNLRGILVTVIDLKKLFNFPKESLVEKTYTIVVSHGNIVIGILVDSIEGSDTYDPTLLDLPLASQRISPEFILGIHQGTTAIINIETIISDANLHINL